MIATAYLESGPKLALMVLLIVGGAITLFDLVAMIIPDELNVLLGVAGLVQACVLAPGDPVDALLGASAGGLLTSALRRWHFRLRGVEGLGLGDVKFSVAAGTWTGLGDLPLFLLAAALAGLAYAAIGMLAGRPIGMEQRVPFAPFLVLGLDTVVGIRLLTGAPVADLLLYSH